MKDDNYLVTGASGFLGSILIKSFKASGTDIVGLSRKKQQINVELSQTFSLPSNGLYNTVIHCAGKAHIVPRTPEEEQDFYKVNFEGTKNLCHALSGLNKLPQSFIFISTVAVYGVDKGENINENHPLNGNTPYAKSKILAEEWLQEWGKENKVVIGILRLPLIAGFNPPGNLGAMIKGIKSGKYLSIGKADARKSVVWAEDIAGIIPRLSEIGGIYNLTDGYHPSFGELESSIAQALGKKRPFKIPQFLANILGFVGDIVGTKFSINSDKLQKITSTLSFDDSKARNELNWKPTKVLDKIEKIV